MINAESASSHSTALKLLEKEYEFTPSSVWNLIECGASPRRDATGISRHNRFLQRNSINDAKVTDFAYFNRVTNMQCINAEEANATNATQNDLSL